MNLKREKTIVLQTCEYNTSYILVRIIVPWIKWGDNGGNSRSASVSCLQNVIHFAREKHTHLPLKLNVIVLSDGCTAQLRSRNVFFVLSKCEASINLTWFYNERHHGKGPMDGIGGTMKNAVYHDGKSGKAVFNDAK